MEPPTSADASDQPSGQAAIDTTPPKRRRRSVWLVWIAIVGVVAFAIWSHTGGNGDADEDPSIVIPELQAKALVGMTQLSFESKEVHREQIPILFGHGFLRQRLIGAVLLNELVDPQAAIKSIDEIRTQIDSGELAGTKEDKKVTDLLQTCYEEETGEATFEMSDEQRQQCQTLFPERLGWVGRLALLPKGTTDQPARTALLDEARRVLFVFLGISVAAACALAIGTLLQIVWWLFLATGRLTSGIRPLQGDDVIYAEMFVLWMALYLGLILLISKTSLAELGLVAMLIPQVVGLGALAWPLVRGLRWNDVREDLGLSLGRPAWAAPFIGAGAYLAAWPLLVMAVIATFILMQIAGLFAGEGGPITPEPHPIVEPILRGNIVVRLQLFLVAVFAAVPEEIMFRGALYPHLRETTARFGYIMSVALAAVISSFIFAIIHPQGLMGVPILMTIAIVFAIVREWRGAIAPSMVAHALVNAGTSMALFLFAN